MGLGSLGWVRALADEDELTFGQAPNTLGELGTSSKGMMNC